MTIRIATLVALALLGTAHGTAIGASSGIYTWTDSAGVTHFSDAPPTISPIPEGNAQPNGADPAAPLLQGEALLDEETPVPATLNELFEPAAGPGSLASSITSDADRGPATAPTIYTPGGNNPRAPTPEELDALDPVWFRGGAAAPAVGPDLYADEYGPFTIGEPIEDTRIPPEVRCQAARRDLEVLRESWPVYRDQGGRLRYQWSRDPYRGVRRYLDEADRKTALAGARQTLQRDCATPDDPALQTAARDGLLRAALCEAERAELAALESLGGDSPGLSLSEKRQLAAEVCGDPVPPAQAAGVAPAQPATAD